jgi:predicted butyrate kinase (DUF1464 family)
MALSIGVDSQQGSWETCVIENGRTMELRTWDDTLSTYEYIRDICAWFPEPIITVSMGRGEPLAPLSMFNAQQLQQISAFRRPQQESRRVQDFLIAIGSLNLSSYLVPTIYQLSTIPAYRKKNRFDMGTSDKLCTIATLLYRMREREAIWQEMRFLYLHVNDLSRTILVVEDGYIVNGIGETAGFAACVPTEQKQVDSHDEQDYQADAAIAEQAFWEGLQQDLAGLMAIHHFEDIIVSGSNKDAVINRLEGSYQLYHFPTHEGEQEGFASASGAAILAEGLYRPGLAGEIVERLQLPRASNRLPGQAVYPMVEMQERLTFFS